MHAIFLGPVTTSADVADATATAIGALLGDTHPVVVVSYAIAPAERPALVARLATLLDREVLDADATHDVAGTIAGASALAVAGGNTWCLAHHLRRRNLVPLIRQRVAEGVPFVGWGAGAIIASPSIMTTVDLPSCDPLGFDGLHLVPFHIAPLPAPCDLSAPSHCAACGSADRRFAELSAGHRDRWIVGLPPRAALRVRGEDVEILGDDTSAAERGVRIYHDGGWRSESALGRELGFLLDEGPARTHRRATRHARHR